VLECRERLILASDESDIVEIDAEIDLELCCKYEDYGC
jgi:hypothetical protein